jgi:hypothetical protein
MAFEVGKRVVAESESTDRRARCGVVEEVLRGDPSPRYRIRWDDSHESTYTPERRPPCRTTPQAPTTNGTTETLTNLRRDDPPRAARHQTPRAQPTPDPETARDEADEIGRPCRAKPQLKRRRPPGCG